MKESFRTVYLEDIHYPGWQRLWGNKSSSNRVAQVVSKLEGVGIAKFIDRFKKSSLVCRISGLSPPEFKDLTKFQKLGIRRWDCPCCRESKDRDIEAAKVIESEGRILHKETEEGLEVGIFIESFILRLQSIVGVHIQF